MNKQAKIYIAGHRGLVGSAIVRNLQALGYTKLLLRTHAELDLTSQAATAAFFEAEKPDYVFLAAAKVGRRGVGIELDPIYVDTALRRLRDATGLVATLAGEGRTFDEIAAD